jgi:hypothetical protein
MCEGVCFGGCVLLLKEGIRITNNQENLTPPMENSNTPIIDHKNRRNTNWLTQQSK